MNFSDFNEDLPAITPIEFDSYFDVANKNEYANINGVCLQ
jgi:hypothetical protein